MHAVLWVALLALFAGCLESGLGPDNGTIGPGTTDGDTPSARSAQDERPRQLPAVPADAPLAPMPERGPFTSYALRCTWEDWEDLLVAYPNGTFYHIAVNEKGGYGMKWWSERALHIPLTEAEAVVQEANATGLFNASRVEKPERRVVEWAAKRQLNDEELRVLRAITHRADFGSLNATYHRASVLDGCGQQMGAWSQGYRSTDTYDVDGPDGLDQFREFHQQYLWMRPTSMASEN